jgi:hypothetical protein
MQKRRNGRQLRQWRGEVEAPVHCGDVDEVAFLTAYQADRKPAGAPRWVNVHDFADKELSKAVPYGV